VGDPAIGRPYDWQNAAVLGACPGMSGAI
jgi:hypothetical protein